jgi:hypothetical protein
MTTRRRHLTETQLFLGLVERVLAKVSAAAAAEATLHRLGARVRGRPEHLGLDGRRKVSAHAPDVPRVILSTPTGVFDVLSSRPQRGTRRQADEIIDQHRGVLGTRRVRVRRPDDSRRPTAVLRPAVRFSAAADGAVVRRVSRRGKRRSGVSRFY